MKNAHVAIKSNFHKDLRILQLFKAVTVLFFFLLLPQAAMAACGVRDPSQPVLGVNITHLRVGSIPPQGCAKIKAAKISADSNLLLNYSDAAIRQNAIGIMQRMRSSGLRSLRLLIWYRSGADAGAQTDRLGVLTPKDAVWVSDRVNEIARQVLDIGFEDLFVAFAPQSRADPTCRAHVAGDCFDINEAASAFGFVHDVISRVHRVAGLRISYDLNNEICYNPELPTAFDRNARAVIQMIEKSVSGWPATGRLVISCAVTSARQMKNRMDSLRQIAAALAPRETVFDIHPYVKASELSETLLMAQDLATRSQKSFVIGEIPANAGLIKLIEQQKSSKQLNNLISVMIWPKVPESPCAIDLDPLSAVELAFRPAC